MILEVGEVVVTKELWEKSLLRDKAAIEQLRKEVDGLFLYSHALSFSPDEFTNPAISPLEQIEQICLELPDQFVKVTIHDLYYANIIEGVEVKARSPK